MGKSPSNNFQNNQNNQTISIIQIKIKITHKVKIESWNIKLIRSQNFKNFVNFKDNQFVILFPFFTVRVTRENEEWWHFGFYQDWRNQDLILKDLSIPHEIILIKTTSKQTFANFLQNRYS